MPGKASWRATRRRVGTACLMAAGAAAVTPAHAQWMTWRGDGDAGMGAPVGSDLERYVRALTVAGIVRPLPWSGRPFSAAELERIGATAADSLHPWSRALRSEPGAALIAPGVVARVNSGFPWGANDGPMWSGRGLTVAAGAGASWRRGPLSLVVAPVAWVAQNAPTPLLANGEQGRLVYADGQFARFVDRPQAFGDRAFAQVDPGHSQLRLEGHGLVVGLGTNNIGWGTGEAFAPLLGANAPGFLHGFLGTSADGLVLNGIGRVGLRYIAGVLDQSRWSTVSGSRHFVRFDEPGTRRMASGLAASFMPAFLPTLELGATRFFHSPYWAGSRKWQALGKPIEGILKSEREVTSEFPGDPQGDLDNQLGTLYARLHLPRRGAEVALEWIREDHSYDLRDLAQEPEQNAAFLASLRVATHRSARRIGMLTLEYFDGDIAPIARQRPQGNLFIHIPLAQGHTQRGQLLGIPIGVGAVSGQRIAWERFDPAGSWRGEIQRWRTRMRRSTDPQNLNFDAPGFIARSGETMFDASVTRLRRQGRGGTGSLTAGAVLASAFNFGGSRLNLYAQLGLRAW
ncbi:MAG: hypothetical protein MUF21_00605 [Gemmatimonadaceae bacterium]|nr:hypothetical protein [Gemmatimonadaceae bacterium]